MALVKCPECAAEVSDSALTCQKCGVQLRKLQRSLIGKITKWVFIAFNLLMAAWMWGGLSSASKTMQGMSGAEHAGAAIGTGLGAVMIGGIWLFGALILGLFVLFTRPKA